MDKKIYTALATILDYLDAEQVELQGKKVGLCVPLLRDYLARQRGSALVKTYWLLEENYHSGLQFPLGQILVTEGALAMTQATRQSLVAFLSRHASGDAGECTARAGSEQRTAQQPMFSSYYVAADTKLWLITDAPRRYTTCLLPTEFDVLYSSGEIDLLPHLLSNGRAD